MKYLDRDLSWLAFNERIIQEAEDPHVSLTDRLNFLAIYSSNLEEFFKVRVANHVFHQKYKGDKKNKFGYRNSFIIKSINEIVGKQQERLGNVFHSEIIPQYREKGLNLLLYNNISLEHKQDALKYFKDNLLDNLILDDITNKNHIELINQSVYLYIITAKKLYLLHLDYKKLGRFISLSEAKGIDNIIQLDDIFKIGIKDYLDEESHIYAIKISRDAELYMDDEQSTDIIKKIKRSIKKRDTGMPSRLLFDENIRFKYINILRKKIDVDLAGLMPGGVYHNFYDFFGFPSPKNIEKTVTPKKIPCSILDNSQDWFEQIRKEDVFLSFPYQDYTYVTDFLEVACEDKAVQEIYITLYRVASDSKICIALERALKNGKKVFVLDEAQARFDEETNIFWGERLQKAGAIVKFGIPNLKIHAKIFRIVRQENDELISYSYLGTGNFNEKTAKIYADHALLTSDKTISSDIELIFDFLQFEKTPPKTQKLLVAPTSLKKKLMKKIKREIEWVEKGKSGHFQIKINSLEDIEMIDHIRYAADKGVKIDLIVRGICCYTPITKEQEKNISVISIVDGFLEHTRIYHFKNNGNHETYLSSADWMNRNLSKRIEVAFPIETKEFENLLIEELQIQLNDSLKGRVVTQNNEKVKGKEQVSSQLKMFDLVKGIN